MPFHSMIESIKILRTVFYIKKYFYIAITFEVVVDFDRKMTTNRMVTIMNAIKILVNGNSTSLSLWSVITCNYAVTRLFKEMPSIIPATKYAMVIV